MAALSVAIVERMFGFEFAGATKAAAKFSNAINESKQQHQNIAGQLLKCTHTHFSRRKVVSHCRLDLNPYIGVVNR
jgi:hypothetical protein